jgi:long-chain acyl-CoA synthetase
MALEAFRRHAMPDAVSHREGGEWRRVSGAEFARRVRSIAAGLHALGVRRGDRVALLSENRPEWSMTDLAILSLGAVNVPVYTTQAVEQVGYILSDSASRVLFVSNRKVFRHARAGVESSPVERVVFFDTEHWSATGRGGTALSRACSTPRSPPSAPTTSRRSSTLRGRRASRRA